MKITQDELKELLHYDPESGLFTRHKSGKIAGSIFNNKYITLNINYKTYYAHRLAWLYMTGKWPPKWIDHIDCDGLNNKWSNLRLAEVAENLQNIKIKPTTGVRKNRKNYTCTIKVSNVSIYIGSFKTMEEAHEAYLEAKEFLHPFYAKNKKI
jgi:hypothetical protein